MDNSELNGTSGSTNQTNSNTNSLPGTDTIGSLSVATESSGITQNGTPPLQPLGGATTDSGVAAASDSTSASSSATEMASTEMPQPSTVRNQEADEMPPLRINLKTIDNKMHPIQVDLSWTVQRFKKEIEEKVGVEVDLQRLLFRGRMLRNEQVLASLKLAQDYCIHLIQRIKSADDEGTDSSNAASNSHTTNQAPSTPTHGAPEMRFPRPQSGQTRSNERATAGRAWQPRRSLLLNSLAMPGASIGAGPGATTRFFSSRPLAPRIASRSAVVREEPPANSLEHICQNFYTLNTLFSTMQSTRRLGLTIPEIRFGDDDDTEEATPTAAPSTNAAAAVGARLQPETKEAENLTSATEKKFYVGQWLDVKDTVNQWLEATIMQMNETSLYVHYNGWPTRWDEWIDKDSDRIAPFRTMTPHSVTSSRLSPTPTFLVSNAQQLGTDDAVTVFAKMYQLLHNTTPLIHHLEQAAWQSRQEALGEAPATQLNQPPASSGGSGKVGEDGSGLTSDIQPGLTSDTQPALGGSPPSPISSQDRLILAEELAPIVDRLGRLLTDIAPHLKAMVSTAATSASSSSADVAPPLPPSATSSIQGAGSQPVSAASSTTTTPLLQAQTTPTASPSLRPLSSPSSPVHDRTPSVQMQSPNRYTNLVSVPPQRANSAAGRQRSFDIHIHAFVTPLRMDVPSDTTGHGSTNTLSAPGTGARGSHVRVPPRSPPPPRSPRDDNIDDDDDATSDGGVSTPASMSPVTTSLYLGANEEETADVSPDSRTEPPIAQVPRLENDVPLDEDGVRADLADLYEQAARNYGISMASFNQTTEGGMSPRIASSSASASPTASTGDGGAHAESASFGPLHSSGDLRARDDGREELSGLHRRAVVQHSAGAVSNGDPHDNAESESSEDGSTDDIDHVD